MRARASQNDFLAKAVGTQSLMDLRDTDLGRTTRVFEAGHRSCAGATGISGDVDDVGAGLGDTDGDGADSFRGHQLHDHPNASCLAVVDELSEVLDGVRVVVRRRRNQFDAGRSAAGGSDVDGDLGGRKLPALTGFCALAEFDLDLFEHRIGEVARPDSEASGCKLLDARCTNRVVARKVFAAFAAVGHRTDHVRAVRDGFVRRSVQCAMAHGTRRQLRGDVACTLYLGERYTCRCDPQLGKELCRNTGCIQHQIRVGGLDGDVVGKGDGKSIAECYHPSGVVGQWTVQAKCVLAVRGRFTPDSTNHDRLIAAHRESADLVGELGCRHRKCDITGHGDDIAQRGGTTRSFRSHDSGKVPVPGGDVEVVDLLGGQPVEARRPVCPGVEAEGVVEPSERQ